MIENLRVELRGIVLPAPSKQIKVTSIIILLFYPSTWHICDVFLLHIEIEGKGGWIIIIIFFFLGGGGGGGGGGQRVWCPPPPHQIIGGGGWPPPLFLCL